MGWTEGAAVGYDGRGKENENGSDLLKDKALLVLEFRIPNGIRQDWIRLNSTRETQGDKETERQRRRQRDKETEIAHSRARKCLCVHFYVGVSMLSRATLWNR